MITEQQKIIKKFKVLSLNYHNLSLLFNELAGSLKIKARELNTLKEFKEYLKKDLNLDFDKIKAISEINLNFENIKKEGLKE